MAGRRAGDLHLGVAGNAAVVGALAGHLPLAVDEGDEAREHQVRVGVFVVDHQQAMVGGAIARNEADVIVVVAELLGLGLRSLVGRVKLGRIGEERITPPQQHVGVIAFSHVMVGVDTGFHFREGEGRATGGSRLFGGHQGKRADGRGDCGNGQRALQKVAARETAADDFAHCGVGAGIMAVPIRLFQLGGREHLRTVFVGHGSLLLRGLDLPADSRTLALRLCDTSA